jgi:hypothetical protein
VATGEFACKFVYDAQREELHRITDKRLIAKVGGTKPAPVCCMCVAQTVPMCCMRVLSRRESWRRVGAGEGV